MYSVSHSYDVSVPDFGFSCEHRNTKRDLFVAMKKLMTALTVRTKPNSILLTAVIGAPNISGVWST